MNVLILGGDGFIGSHLLAKHIERGDSCIVVDKHNIRTTTKSKNYKFVKHDFFVKSNFLKTLLAKYKPDLIYNCVAVATPSYYVKEPIKTFELDFLVNYENICKPVLKTDIPFIHFSTSEVYGKKWTEVYDERSTNLIIGPTYKTRWVYASSKILLEQLLLANTKNNCIIIRPQNFCGWDMDWLPSFNNREQNWIPRLPACFLNNLMSNKSLYVVLPGTQKRCYTHINDAVDGIYSIVKNWSKCIKKEKIFNIGNKHNETTIINLANLYKKIWTELTDRQTKPIRFIKGDKLYGKGYEDCERRMFSDERVCRLTGWKPKLDLNTTIKLILQEAIEKYS